VATPTRFGQAAEPLSDLVGLPGLAAQRVAGEQVGVASQLPAERRSLGPVPVDQPVEDGRGRIVQGDAAAVVGLGVLLATQPATLVAAALDQQSRSANARATAARSPVPA